MPFDAAAAVPAPLDTTIAKIDWVHWSPGGLGSSGVFFVNVGPGWLVLKPVRPGSAGEMYAGELAQRLGIHCPRTRALHPKEADGLKLRMSTAPWTSPEDKDRIRTHRVPTFIVMEFVKAVPLPAIGFQVLGGDHGGKVLEDMGRVVALDMVTNNFDRVPLCWPNQGNLENFLVSPEGSVVALDMCVSVITHPDDPASNPDSKAWKRVKESFSNYTGVDIGDDGCNHLYLGVQAGIKALGDLMLTTPTVFEDVKSQVEHMLRSDGQDLAGLKLIDTEFLSANLALLVEGL